MLMGELNARVAIATELPDNWLDTNRAEILQRWMANQTLQPDDAGAVYEATLGWRLDAASATLVLDPALRARQGSFYTPKAIVDGLLAATLGVQIADALAQPDPIGALLAITVLDPSCGTGHFLLAAGRMLAQAVVAATAQTDAPLSPSTASALVAQTCLYGVDLDSGAVGVARTILGATLGGAADRIAAHVVVGNALVGAPLATANPDAWCQRAVGKQAAQPTHGFHWFVQFSEAAARGGFAVVVGNPPYLNQLQRSTAQARDDAAILRARTHGAVKGLADASTAFFALVPEWLQPGGRAAFVVPHAFLTGHDARLVRQSLAQQLALTGLWYAKERVFADAQVHTCAPVLHKAPPATVLARWHRADFAATTPLPVDAVALRTAQTWAALVADLNGIPRVDVTPQRVLGDIAHATADFRDQYYGLLGCIVDQQEAADALFPPLLTSGLIDLARSLWGEQQAKILKQSWQFPRVDAAKLAATTKLGPWLQARLVPKVLVATQTAVFEVVVDTAGAWLPSVPVVTVTPHRAEDLWQVAAAIASPIACVWAATHYAGAGMSVGALKLSAAQLLDAPLPDLAAECWQQAVERFRLAHACDDAVARQVHLHAFGAAAVHAYGLLAPQADAVLKWWRAKLAPKRQ